MRTISLLLILWSARAFTLPSIAGERLFRVEKDGRTSHILASVERYAHDAPGLGPVMNVLSQSCAVLLEGDTLHYAQFQYHYPASMEVGALRRLLPRNEFELFTKIVSDHFAYFSVKPGYGAALVRAKFLEALMNVAGVYHEQLKYMSTSEVKEKFNGAHLDPALDEAVRLLYGERPSNVQLLTRFLADEVALRAFNLIDWTYDQAQDLNLAVETLEVGSGDSLLEADIRMSKAENLIGMLGQLAGKFQPARGYDLLLDFYVANLVSVDLAKRSFSLDPLTYGKVADALSRSLMAANAWFTTDQDLADHASNVHEPWLDAVKEAAAREGSLIVLNAARVIPGIDPRVRRPVLSELEAAGFTVTPLRAEDAPTEKPNPPRRRDRRSGRSGRR